MSSSRSWTRVVVLALLFAVGAWLAFELASKPSSSEPGESAEVSRNPAAASPEAPNLQLVERQAAADIVGSAEAAASELSTLPGSGRVVDDVLGAPLQACVRPDVGPAVFSDGESGAFVLDERHRGATRLRVSEVGFEELDVDAAPAFQESGVELRLKGARAAAVYVEHSDGRPAEGVSVTWRLLDPLTVARPSRERATSEPRVAAAVSERRTDSNGVCGLFLGVPAQAQVRDPRAPDDAVHVVQLLPGEQRTVVLGPFVTLRFVDFVSREPLPGLELDAWPVREFGSLARALLTDSNGVVRLPWSSAPLLLRLPGARAYEAELRPLSPGAERTGYGADYHTMLRIDEPPRDPDDELLVGVRRCGQRLRLVDAATREPVETDVVVLTVDAAACGVRGAEQPGRCTWYSPSARGARLDSVQRSTGGLLDLLCGLYAPDGGPGTANPTLELVLLAAGYAPKRFTAPSTPPQDRAPLELELERVPQRWLRVVHENGRPFRLAVDVYSPSVDMWLWISGGRSDGLHGPFDALDGDVRVLGTLIPADAWANSDTYTLRVPDDTGAIEIVGAPPGVSFGAFVARMPPDLEPTEFAPTALTSDGCRFDALPASSYLVGPREWARAAELHSVNSGKIGESLKARAVRVAVPPGETVRVPWVSCWAAGRELSGQVTWRAAARPELRLVPYYVCGSGEGPEHARGAPLFPLGRATPHVPLDRNGGYRIAPDDPLPWLLAVCLADERPWGSVQGLQVVESIRPGESLELSFATLILRWEGAPPSKPQIVSYEIAAESLRHPLSTFHRDRRRTWNTASPLTLDFVPTRITEISIHGRKLAFAPLEPGEVREIAVKIDELPPPEPHKH
jgi:hypothetical protein